MYNDHTLPSITMIIRITLVNNNYITNTLYRYLAQDGAYFYVLTAWGLAVLC